MNCNKIIKTVIDNNLHELLLNGNFGIERENLRVTQNGTLAQTDHPTIFGDKLRNPYITVDFAESQMELITPPLPNIKEMCDFLENLNDIVLSELKDEYLWPQSTPPEINQNDEIKEASFKDGVGKSAADYRQHLSKKYGKIKQLLSGIHFNFSFNDDFLNAMFTACNTDLSFKEFKNSLYLRVAKNYTKYRWIIVYLLGASPSIHKTYCSENKCKLGELKDTFSFIEGISFRQSASGYRNSEEFFVPLETLDGYIEAINKLISDGKIIDAREYYSPIRLKSGGKKNTLESLKQNGIEYLEIRTIDINPYHKLGIAPNDLYFLHLFLIYCLLKKCENENDCIFSELDNKNANINQERIAIEGQNNNIEIADKNIKKTAQQWALNILEEITCTSEYLNITDENYLNAVKYQKEKIENPDNTYSRKLLKDIENSSFIQFHMEKAREYKYESIKYQYRLKGYADMELSTQILIRNAIKRGIKFEILDSNDNTVRFSNNIKKEIVKQATKTSLDTYICSEIMNNKLVSKILMKEKSINVPDHNYFSDIEAAKKSYSNFIDKRIVIKPRSENYGLGISIFKNNFTKNDFSTAIDLAFANGGPALIEEFIEGDEYRFLVINGKVHAVLRRVPANVKGDGINTIEKLVCIKNMDPLRGEGYKTPLEKIKLTQIEKTFLSSQNKDFDYIPLIDEVVFLRQNSNISTGGDSIDYTDKIDKSYSTIAVKAAESVNAKICGVDMMIKDIAAESDNNNYAIIEVNYNPAIHIHEFPYSGKQRKIADIILDSLGF